VKSLWFTLAITLSVFVQPVRAETPQQILSAYTAEAARQTANYKPSPDRGRQFFTQHRSTHEKMPNCAACHGDNPTTAGRHVITNKTLEPLAPVSGSERFTSATKVEKWFRRNCGEVVGRECTAAEKADFLRYLLSTVGA